MFKQLLKENKITQQIISKELNVTQSLVSQWCSGKCEPRINQLIPLSKILKVDLFTLVDCFNQNQN